LLSSLNLTDDERGIIRQTLDCVVQELPGGNGLAVLTIPINIDSHVVGQRRAQ